MPPIETPDVQPADSSPALAVPARGSAEYTEWRNTGKLPEPKAASTPAKETPASQEGTTAPASETGTNQEKKKPRDTAADRLAELLDDIRQTGYTPAELKALRKQAKQETQQQAEPPKPAAPEKTVNPAELKAPSKPVKKDFFEGGKYATYDEAETAFEAARDKYVEDLVDYKEALRDQTAQQQAAQQSVHEKMQEAKGRYGDEAVGIISATARAFTGDEQIPQAVKGILNDSPVWPDVLYTLGSKPEELAAFVHLAKTDPGAAIRKAIVIEQLVTAELAKGGKQAAPAASDDGEGDATPRGEDGKFKKTTPEKKESNAPPPPKEVSGRGTPPADEVERAVKTGDFRSFKQAANDRDLKQRRG